MQSTMKTLFTQYKQANFKKVKRGKGKTASVRVQAAEAEDAEAQPRGADLLHRDARIPVIPTR